MKKRTLNQTWTLCLRMWRWIAKNKGRTVKCYRLKAKWLRVNGFKYVVADCFFCDFAQNNCKRCPGKLVDPNFDCGSSDYCYSKKPVAFYKELLRLNRIRKG